MNFLGRSCFSTRSTSINKLRKMQDLQQQRMHSKLAYLLLLPLCLFTVHTTASDPDPVDDFCIPNTETTSSEACKNPRLVIPEDFVYSGIRSAGNFSVTGLSTQPVNHAKFPGLNTLGMSLVRADLKPGGINPPHFHPRATEMVYVLQGKVYSGFVDSTNRVFAKVIEQGDVMVFPRGLVHFQMNVGNSPATVYGCFNSQNPGTQKIPNVLFGSGINDELLEKAFGLSIHQISAMRRRFLPKAR